MTFKFVMRYSPPERLLRLFRLVWRWGCVGDGVGYSAKLSFGLTPTIFGAQKEFGGWRVIFLGLRVHLQRSWGGVIV